MVWIWYVVLAIVGLTAFNIAGKLSGGKMEPMLSSSIACLSAGVFLSIVTLMYYWKNNLSFTNEFSTAGSYPSLLVGLTIVMVNTGYIFAFTKGGPIGAVGPIVSGASIGLVVIISALFFGEGMSMNKVLGATFLGAGIMFIIKG